jgi:hypothetical protein
MCHPLGVATQWQVVCRFAVCVWPNLRRLTPRARARTAKETGRRAYFRLSPRRSRTAPRRAECIGT